MGEGSNFSLYFYELHEYVSKIDYLAKKQHRILGRVDLFVYKIVGWGREEEKRISGRIPEVLAVMAV